jgi:hypothetical protein
MKMHMVSAKVMLGGDAGQVVHRGKNNPFSWPEIGVLQWMHGEDSVFDIEFAAEVESSRSLEKQRLVEKYGADTLEMVYPGKAPYLEMEMPGVVVPASDGAAKGKKGKKSTLVFAPADDDVSIVPDTED